MTSTGNWGNSVVDQFAVFGMWDTIYDGTRNFIGGFGETYFITDFILTLD
jgi:hypothetical protein